MWSLISAPHTEPYNEFTICSCSAVWQDCTDLLYNNPYQQHTLIRFTISALFVNHRESIKGRFLNLNMGFKHSLPLMHSESGFHCNTFLKPLQRIPVPLPPVHTHTKKITHTHWDIIGACTQLTRGDPSGGVALCVCLCVCICVL